MPKMQNSPTRSITLNRIKKLSNSRSKIFRAQIDRLKRTKQSQSHGLSTKAKFHLIFSVIEKKRQLRMKGLSMKS